MNAPALSRDTSQPSSALDTEMEAIEWTTDHEKIFVEWADNAMCYRCLHTMAHSNYSNLNAWYTIPVIIISTLTGTANFAQSQVPLQYQAYYSMMVGGFNLLAGIITTIQQFLKITQLSESHRVASIAWDKLYRNIKIELARSPNERMRVVKLINLCKEEYDRLISTCPIIPDEIIARFKTVIKTTTAQSKPSNPPIIVPEICGVMVSTDLARNQWSQSLTNPNSEWPLTPPPPTNVRYHPSYNSAASMRFTSSSANTARNAASKIARHATMATMSPPLTAVTTPSGSDVDDHVAASSSIMLSNGNSKRARTGGARRHILNPSSDITPPPIASNAAIADVIADVIASAPPPLDPVELPGIAAPTAPTAPTTFAPPDSVVLSTPGHVDAATAAHTPPHSVELNLIPLTPTVDLTPNVEDPAVVVDDIEVGGIPAAAGNNEVIEEAAVEVEDIAPLDHLDYFVQNNF